MAMKLNFFFSFSFFIHHQFNLQFAQKKKASEHAQSACEEACIYNVYRLLTLFLMNILFIKLYVYKYIHIISVEIEIKRCPS
jgi:hypothetical protein